MYQMKKKQESQTKADASKTNRTGIPSPMKTHFEAMSGQSYDDVRIHYRSQSPAQLQALAYTRGNEVFLAPGQERHLPHELVHIAQQKSGIVQPTRYIAGVPVNDNTSLEKQADVLRFPPAQVMGEKSVDTIQRMKGLTPGTRVEVYIPSSKTFFIGVIIEIASENSYVIQPDKGEKQTISEEFVTPYNLAPRVIVLPSDSSDSPVSGQTSTIILDPIYGPNRVVTVPSELVEEVGGDIEKIEAILWEMTGKKKIEFGVVQAGNIFSNIRSGRAADEQHQTNAAVSIPKEFTDQIKADTGNQDIVLTHTHPQSSPLSRVDIMMAVNGNYKEIRAVGEDGVYSLKRTGAAWPFELPADVFPYFGEPTAQGISSKFPTYQTRLQSGPPKNSDGDSDLNHDWLLIQHFAALKIAQDNSDKIVYTSPLTTEDLIERRRPLYKPASTEKQTPTVRPRRGSLGASSKAPPKAKPSSFEV